MVPDPADELQDEEYMKLYNKLVESSDYKVEDITDQYRYSRYLPLWLSREVGFWSNRWNRWDATQRTIYVIIPFIVAVIAASSLGWFLFWFTLNIVLMTLYTRIPEKRI